jgi:hypothetical protein
MSIRSKRSRSQRAKSAKSAKSAHAKRKEEFRSSIEHDQGPSLPDLPDDAHVMPFSQWCEVASIGQRTGRRLLQKGLGPVVTMLSEWRIGITYRHHREWLARRAQRRCRSRRRLIRSASSWASIPA